ncbi:ATP-binding protein [Streptomyces sp. NPDC058280]|uniref:ATP-binding protein n=1 Tax=Streptomyces sp. NPDC058280 TaxID=3346419 RepID=UPI0036E24981
MTTPANEDAGEGFAAPVRIEAHAADNARVYMAGRDLHVTQEAAAAPAPVTALRTLPRDVAAFTGRQAEVKQLLAAAQPTRVVAIHTVDGMPGVGKTALVVHAARQLTTRFPDGQLFVRLHAHTPGQNPADPADALAALLISIGIDPRHIPDSMQARADLWRDRLTGRRMLLILDDAADHAQVEPLLPGAEGCLVMVTSRRRLPALDGATPLPLGTLQPEDAALLFTRLARRTPTPAEAGAVADIVRLCGYLPLAIALLAGRFAHHPHWNLAEYAQEFAATQDRLGELAAGDRAVAAAFEMSYRALPPQRQGLFRRLGLHPGPETDAYATAALAGIPLVQARSELEALYTDHLIDSPATGRYRLHDLLRAYARTLAERDTVEDRDAATGRLLDYYQHTAEAADRHLAEAPRHATPVAGPSPAAAPGLASHEQAMTWMRTERANLIACTHHATATARHSHAIYLTAILAAFLRQQGPWDEAISLHQTAAASARLTGDRLSQAGTLAELGWVRYLTGDFPAAADLLQQALELYRALGNLLGKANALRELGWVRYLTGDIRGAADLAQQALELYRALGNPLGEAYALRELGWVRYATGDYSAAADLAQQALNLSRALGNPLSEAYALTELGRVQYVTGDFPAAADLARQALELYRALGNRLSEAYSLWDLGRVQYVTGDFPAAADLTRQALDLFRTLSNRHGEANALQQLGQVQAVTEDHPAAADLLQKSLTLFQEVGDIQGEAEVLNSTGALLAASARPGEALSAYQRALHLARQVHSPLDEAHALEGTARCHARTRDLPAALADLRQAVGIYQRIGAAEASAAAEYLTQLQAEHPKEAAVQDSTD